jgi:hypothetical protein
MNTQKPILFHGKCAEKCFHIFYTQVSVHQPHVYLQSQISHYFACLLDEPSAFLKNKKFKDLCDWVCLMLMDEKSAARNYK